MVILSTIFPVGAPSLARRPVWSPDVAVGVEEVNTFLGSLTADSIRLLDASALLSGKDGLIRREYSKDLLHINDAGYALLNQELIDLLQKRSRIAQPEN